MVVDPVGRANAHSSADLAQRRRVTAVRNRLLDEVEHHLLPLRKALAIVPRTLPEHAFPSSRTRPK